MGTGLGLAAVYGLDEGMHGFLHKPFERNDLLRQVAAAAQT